MYVSNIVVLLVVLAANVHAASPVIHYTIERRDGFLAGEFANLTQLGQLLEEVERRYSLTRRGVKGNRLVRSVISDSNGGDESHQLMSNPGMSGRWYATLNIGDPPQAIEMDLDMLSSDFFIMTTTSFIGPKFNSFQSLSHAPSGEHPHPLCSLPSDLISLPTVNTSVRIQVPLCSPRKASRATLAASGSVLGLTASSVLGQIEAPTLLEQLLEQDVISESVWSVFLLDNHSGILTLGGTCAANIEGATTRIQVEIESIGRPDVTPEMVEQRVDSMVALSRLADWRSQFKWSTVQGAEGWWQTLLAGIWINASKIMKNQPVVLDLNSPFVLAPPQATRKFYEAVPGARRLEAPYDQFYVFPCLNPPNVAFEFAGWNFPALQGASISDYWGPLGGKLSLGKLRAGSGYCVGAVVESKMGVRLEQIKAARKVTGPLAGEMAGNGMKDAWVIGEPFFRTVGVVFDTKKRKVGFRTY